MLAGTLVTITGTTGAHAWEDPMWVKGNDRIYKRCRIDQVEDTVARWLSMDRVITGITR